MYSVYILYIYIFCFWIYPPPSNSHHRDYYWVGGGSNICLDTLSNQTEKIIFNTHISHHMIIISNHYCIQNNPSFLSFFLKVFNLVAPFLSKELLKTRPEKNPTRVLSFSFHFPSGSFQVTIVATSIPVPWKSTALGSIKAPIRVFNYRPSFRVLPVPGRTALGRPSMVTIQPGPVFFFSSCGAPINGRLFQ